MAGEVYSGIASVAAAGTTNIQPGSGIEAVIHNIYAGGKMELYYYDGTNSILIDAIIDVTGGGSLQGRCFHITNTRYLQIKNTGTATALFGYDGVQTK